MCSNALHSDFHAHMMLKSWWSNLVIDSENPCTVAKAHQLLSYRHRHVYTVAWLTLCYGWRVGIVIYIFIVTATAAPTSDLTLPYLTLIITLADYIILP